MTDDFQPFASKKMKSESEPQLLPLSAVMESGASSAGPKIGGPQKSLEERNATLADELVRTGSSGISESTEKPSSTSERVQIEALRRNLEEASRSIEMLKLEKCKIEAEVDNCRNLAGKLESDLKSLSDAYNSLEQDNFRLEMEAKALMKGGKPYPDMEAIREVAREEAQKESDLNVIQRLTSSLAELGVDVDFLLEGIGDDAAIYRG